MKVVLILASWSSGSTAVAGYLDKCGCYSCPPHQTTIDLRTPITYEPKEYKAALTSCIDESTLKRTGKVEDFSQFFATWLPIQMEKAKQANCDTIVLKHALQTFFLEEITRICKPVLVVVTRPFEKIEQTRIRRQWHPVYGSAGARTLYNTIYSHLQNNNLGYLALPYEKLCSDDDVQRGLLDYCGLVPSDERLSAAKAWLQVSV